MSFLWLILIVVGLLLAAAVLYGRFAWSGDRRLAQRLSASLLSQPRSTARFDPASLASLPEPARRYLTRAIQPGAPVATTARLDFSGSIHFGGLEGQAHRISGQGALVTAGRGFVWPERIELGAVPRVGYLFYADGEGRASWSLAGAVLEPLKHRGIGPDGSRAMRNLFACKLIWLPTALLPEAGATWEAVDDHRARATVTLDGEAMPITIKVDGEGRLEEAVLQRWGAKAAGGAYGSFPYGLRVLAEREFGSYRLPSEVQAIWFYGEEGQASPLAHTYVIERAELA